MSSHNTFVRGAAILAAAGVVVRLMGAALRIILASPGLLGDQGIGLYQMAYPVFSTLLTISTAGIPVAISKLIAENLALSNYRQAFRVFRIALIILTLTGLVITLAMLGGAGYIAEVIIRQPLAYNSLAAIAPAIFFVTMMSVFRGYFQGRQRMLPTAISQLVEQLGRVIASLYLVITLLPRGLEFAAAGASFGAVAGSVLGLAVLLIIYFWDRPRFKGQVSRRALPGAGFSKIVSQILRLAVPITLGSLIMQLFTLIDLGLVTRRLQVAGFTVDRATALYGQLTGMASSVIYFPNVVVIALGVSLVPAISEALARKNRELITGRTDLAIKITVLFSLPAAVGLYILAAPITVFLFTSEAVEAAAPLAALSWSVIALSLYITSTNIMQGLGRPTIPVLNMVYGGAVKAILCWFLTANPVWNVVGAAVASLIGLAVAAIANLYYLTRLTGWKFNTMKLVIRPGIAVVVMAAAVHVAYRGFFPLAGYWLAPGPANGVAVIGSIAVGLAIYGLALLLSGSINREELNLVPILGGFLVKLTGRYNLLRK
ncbi:MAG: polysaccharide biosynthesis protein [Firmicutes bacterium]|nr:polysaccharide biosynthesis protein [Bacillota bacterium]